MIKIGNGELAGYQLEYKFGRRTAVGLTERSIWDGSGVYPFPTSDTVATVKR